MSKSQPSTTNNLNVAFPEGVPSCPAAWEEFPCSTAAAVDVHRSSEQPTDFADYDLNSNCRVLVHSTPAMAAPPFFTSFCYRRDHWFMAIEPAPAKKQLLLQLQRVLVPSHASVLWLPSLYTH